MCGCLDTFSSDCRWSKIQGHIIDGHIHCHIPYPSWYSADMILPWFESYVYDFKVHDIDASLIDAKVAFASRINRTNKLKKYV